MISPILPKPICPTAAGAQTVHIRFMIWDNDLSKSYAG